MPEWRGRIVPDDGLTPEVVQALQDRVLASLTSKGPADREALRELPPWRAATLARVAYRAGSLSREERDAVVREATMAHTQGDRLRPWKDERALRASGSRRRA
jgi:hypothetical protein